MKYDTNITALADALGDIKATIAPLTNTESDLKKEIIALGQAEIEGERYRVTVVTSDAKGLATDKVKALLDELVEAGKISPQKRAAMFTKSTRTAVRCVARTRKV